MSDRPVGAEQLPLALRYPPDQRLDTFVGAPPGSLAQLRALAEAGGSQWLYLQGPSGTGKTHLALAACATAQAAEHRTAYLPLQAASGRLSEALDTLEGNALIALDGLEAIAGHRPDEVALFEFHNRARHAGIALLYTARVAPDGLALTLPDLRSRLAQCNRLQLPALDDEGRREVLRARAQRRGLILDEASLDWLLRRVDRDITGLTGLLDVLDCASLAAKRRITVPFLRQTLDAS